MSFIVNVIIPSFNAFDVLRLTLVALNNQTLQRDKYAIIVVDDSSSSSPPKNVVNDVDIWVSMPRHGGPSVCRNKALSIAPESYATCFLGQDTVPKPDFLENHLNAISEKTLCASLGGIYFPDKYIEESPFMDWLEQQSYQFDYPNIASAGPKWFHAYTSNLMVPNKAISQEPFDWETFPYLFEDVDFGFQLAQRGVEIVYTHSSSVLHYHRRTLSEFIKRQYLAGMAAYRFYKKYNGVVDGDIFAVKSILSSYLPALRDCLNFNQIQQIEKSKFIDSKMKYNLISAYDKLLRHQYAKGVIHERKQD